MLCGCLTHFVVVIVVSDGVFVLFWIVYIYIFPNIFLVFLFIRPPFHIAVDAGAAVCQFAWTACRLLFYHYYDLLLFHIRAVCRRQLAFRLLYHGSSCECMCKFYCFI